MASSPDKGGERCWKQLLSLMRYLISGDTQGLETSEAESGGAESLLYVASRQALTGQVYEAVKKSGISIIEDEELSLTLLASADKIESRSLKVAAAAEKLLSFYRREGLKPIIMKGPSVAAHYPTPELRTSGDIDFFIEGDKNEIFKKSVDLLTAQKKKTKGLKAAEVIRGQAGE